MVNKAKSLSLIFVLTCYAGMASCADTSNAVEKEHAKGDVESTAEVSAEVGVDENVEVSAEKNVEVRTDETSGELQHLLSLEADVEFGAYLSGECLTCHLPSGDNGAIPHIHGKAKDILANALLEYRSKARLNTVMQGVSAALSNDEIAALVTYLSEQ